MFQLLCFCSHIGHLVIFSSSLPFFVIVSVVLNIHVNVGSMKIKRTQQTRHAEPTLVQCWSTLRLWTSIQPMLDQRIVFAG